MTNEVLKGKISELKDLKNMKTEIEAMISKLESEIKGEMTDRGVQELILDEFKVTWKPITRTGIDAESLKKLLPEIAARFTRTTESRRFVVN